MRISRLSTFGLAGFLVFLLLLLFSYNEWHIQFRLVRLSFITFFVTGLAIFFRPKNRLFTKIISSFFLFMVALIPIGFLLGGIFMGIVLSLLLFLIYTLIGPDIQVKQANLVIQRPYQGFFGVATRFDLVERKNLLFERKLGTFQSDLTRINSFTFDPATRKVSLNNAQQIVYLQADNR